MARRRSRHARPPARRRAEARRVDRPLQHALGSDRAEEARTCARLERSRVPVADRGHGAQRPARARHRAARHALRRAGVGERRPQGERAAEELADVRRLRLRRCEALPVRPEVDDLERAEPEPLPRRNVAEPLRQDAAQSRLRGDPPREPACARRGRRDRAAREQRWLRAARLGARACRCPREARRVRAQPVSDAAARDAAARRVRLLRRHLDGEPRPAVEAGAALPRKQADLAHRVRLPDEPARLASASRRTCRRRTSARRRCVRTSSRACRC